MLNYVIMRPTMACITLLTSWAGVYQGGSLSLTNAYPYVTLVCNLSQAWSLYCLVRSKGFSLNIQKFSIIITT